MESGELIYRLLAGEVVGGEGTALEQTFKITLVHHLAAFASGSGAKVYYVVGCAHHLFVMLDDHDRVALVSQTLERCDKTFIVPWMQTYRRLVKHVQNSGKAASYLRGEPDALHFAARKR